MGTQWELLVTLRTHPTGRHSLMGNPPPNCRGM
jgi:hypothetical protein